MIRSYVPVRAAFTDRRKNCKSLVSGDSSGGSDGRGGGGSRDGGSGRSGGDISGGASQSPYVLSTCNSSSSLHPETHFSPKIKPL